MMVVPVLITSCHVSLKRKIGPVMPHIITSNRQAIKVHGLPAVRAVAVAKALNSFSITA